MYLKRIEKINYNIFKKFTWNPAKLNDFSGYNAIYGWNASGKTTISSALRSLEENEGFPNNFNSAKNYFEVKTDDGKLKLSKDLNRNVNIRVFNEDFVDESLEWEKGRANSILIVGKKNKTLKKELEKKKSDLTDRENELKSRKEDRKKRKEELKNKKREIGKEIKNILYSVKIPSFTEKFKLYENYDGRGVEEIIDKELDLPEFNKKKKKELREKVGEENPLDPVDKIKINLEKETFNNNLKEVKELLKNEVEITLQVDNSDEKEWLERGFKLHGEFNNSNHKCKFCHQKISKERVKELIKYFKNEDYRKLKRKINKNLNNFEELRDNLPEIQISKEKLYTELRETFVESKKDYKLKVNKFKNNIKKIENKLNVKLKNPSRKINIDDKKIVSNFNNLIKAVNSLNSIKSKHNSKSNNFNKRQKKNAHLLEKIVIAENKLDYLKLKQKIRKQSSEIKKVESCIDEIKKIIEGLKVKLDDKGVAAGIFNNKIKRFLGREDLHFRMDKENEGYIISRNGNKVSWLSEGERNAVALIYFLTKLEEEKFDQENGVIVIDDPVSSFDSKNIFNAYAFLKAAIEDINPNQFFIFTHNFYFFRQIKRWFRSKQQNNFSFYQIKTIINKNERYSKLKKLDNLLENYETEYHYLFKLIYNNCKKEESDMESNYVLPNVIRKFLENYLSFKVPERSGIKDSLEKIKNQDYNIDNELLDRVEKFIQQLSHSSDLEFDDCLLGEIDAVCKDVCDLMQKTDQKHYDGLLEAVGEAEDD